MDAWALLTHLRRIQRGLSRRTSPLFHERGLPTAALYMLAAVSEHPFPSQMGREMGLPAPSVSRLLKVLEADGYLERETVPQDLRRYRFHLTGRGRELRAEARRRIEAALEAMLTRLNPEERMHLDRLLGALAGMEGENDGE